MRAEDEGPVMAASVIAFIGTWVGYLAPVTGGILAVCLLLVVIAGLIGGAGGAVVQFLARPFAELGRWWAQKDAWRLVRLTPVFGLVFGWLLRWSVHGVGK